MYRYGESRWDVLSGIELTMNEMLIISLIIVWCFLVVILLFDRVAWAIFCAVDWWRNRGIGK